MLDVLMTTVPEDIHAGAVSVALDRLGCRTVRWYPSAYPLGDEIEFSHALGRDPVFSLTQAGTRKLDFPADEVRSFWYRRQGSPTLSAMLHEADRSYASLSCEFVTDAAIASISGLAQLSVNNFHAALIADRSKLLQLQTAHALGFQCPLTLISNSPEQVIAFIRASEEETIFKSFMMAAWEDSAVQATNFTSTVRVEDLPSEQILRSAPGIFQRKLDKQFEIRVTIMGNWLVAVKLDSQSLDDSRIDWRVSGAAVPLEEVTLPVVVSRRCVELLRRLHLNFGCIDLIVTPEGEYVFLEVNQQGQWLWIEECAPQIPLVDTFAQFLASGDPKFDGPSCSPRCSFNAIRDEAWEMLQEDMRAYPFSIDVPSNTINEEADAV